MVSALPVLLAVTDLSIAANADGRMDPILQGIDLSLNTGEVLGIIGESGAGKSTLGLALMGYLARNCVVTAGSVAFEGTDLFKLAESRRRDLRGVRIAYVAQSAAASFNPCRRLIDQHIEAAVQHGLLEPQKARDEAAAIYGELGLPAELALRFPHQVSGGQLQRAMIAMAMSCRPDVIIFDEPTTALDVTTQIGVLSALRQVIRNHRLSGVYISHDLALVAQMSDRIVVLRHGRVVETADTATMLQAPKDDYTKSLWAVRALAKPQRTDTGLAPELLSIEALDAHYGAFQVLHNINFSLTKGQAMAIVGESGSGKSSLARALIGILSPTNGRVRFEGTVLPSSYKGRSADQLRRIQFIYQMADTALNPRHSVKTTIERPLKLFFKLPSAMREERIRSLMAAVELDERLLHRKTKSLSGGQKQRVAIARALAAEPSLLICDEVTSALDQIVAEEVLKLLLRLQSEMLLSILFITHDLSAAKAVSDRIMVMQKGKIVEVGEAQQVLTSPTETYTRELIASIPQLRVGWLDEKISAARAKRQAI